MLWPPKHGNSMYTPPAGAPHSDWCNVGLGVALSPGRCWQGWRTSHQFQGRTDMHPHDLLDICLQDPLALQTPLELFKQYQNLQTFDLTPTMEEPGKRGQHKKRPLALPLLPEHISDYLAEGPAVAAADDVEAPDFGSLFRTASKWKKVSTAWLGTSCFLSVSDEIVVSQNRKLHRELRGLSARMNAYHRQKK